MADKSMVRDLTSGNPLKQLLSFSFPFVLANLLQQVYNMADMVIVGQFVGKRFSELLGAEKVQVFKSGYFARAAAPCKKDLKLIETCARKAVECALNGVSGVVGPDENAQAKIQACDFTRVRGGKPFNVRKGSFRKLMDEIGQPRPRKKRTLKEDCNG